MTRITFPRMSHRHSKLPSVLIAICTLFVAQPRGVSAETLQFRSLGPARAEESKAALRINDLNFFEGRLYLGRGDWFKNTGPTDVISYDFSKRNFVNEHTVDEEAIDRYRQYGNRLFVPGTDSTESWEFGNLYVRESSTWKKYRSIPRGLHVFDFAEYDGRWYVAAGSYFNDIKKGPWIGVIYSSEDHAKSWQYEYVTASSGGTVSRMTSLMPYKGRLFAFGYTDGPMPRGSTPKLFPAGKAKQSNRVAQSIKFDGDGWFPAGIMPATKLIQTIEPVVFADHLLLNTRVGRYGPNIKNEWHLLAYNGTATRRLPLECDRIVDMLVKDDLLILLLVRQGEPLLVESTDLVHWDTHTIAPKIGMPLAVEYDGTTYYLGLSDGTIMIANRKVK